MNSAEVVHDESTLTDEPFETCVRESLYGVYFDPPPTSARATLNFEIAVRGGDGGIDETVDDFHPRDRCGESDPERR